jgi:hypothetical protein
MVGKSWSYANDRRVIELAKASKSLALLWRNLAIDRRYRIPESGFQ